MVCIHWVSEGYIQQYSPETKVFRPMSNPEGTACLPRDSTEDEKSLVEAAILLYIARRDPIYIIYIPHFLF